MCWEGTPTGRSVRGRQRRVDRKPSLGHCAKPVWSGATLRAHQCNKGPQSGGQQPAAGVVQVKAFVLRPPVVQHADQPPGGQHPQLVRPARDQRRIEHEGAELTHGNICANIIQAKEWIGQSLDCGKETAISALPLYHIFALTVNTMFFMEMGATNLLITNPRDLPALIKDIKKHNITVFVGVNTLFNALVNRDDFKSLDFSRWKLALGGGMAVQKAVADKWKAVTGIPIVEAYGLTEASPGVTINPINITAYTGSIGLPIPGTEIEIRDDAGKEVAVGQPGELWIKGPQVMKGYWQRPDETAKALDSRGFLASGDVAVIDEKGWIKLVDRKKDMIVVSGFNVYPNEIEDVIAHHPKVLEVACIGINSEKTGEALKLFVVKKDPSLTEEELVSFARQELTGYKVPKNIEFRDELPKSNVGKILRRELRDEAQKAL